MKQIPASVLNLLLAASLLVGCTQPKEVAIEGVAERTPKADEALPPLEEFSVRDTIIHSIHQKNPRLDLQNLRFYNKKVNRSDLVPLQTNNVSHIKQLILSDLQLDDVDIEPISKMKLTKLNLGYNPVRDLHALRDMNTLAELVLDFSQVNRDGLQVTASLKNLTVLYASGTTISDADLLLFYSLKRLKKLALNECKNVSPRGVAKLRLALPRCIVWTGARVKGFHEIGLSDLRTVEQGLMQQREYAEADLALQKYISKWKEEKSLPYALLAEAYRLRGECQKALGNATESQSMMAESSKYGRRSRDLKNHPE
jgi:hypothetical protein